MAEPAGQQTVRAHNLGLVLQQIAAVPGSSRAQVAAATGLTRATVSALVDDLREGGLVAEGNPALGLRGRPASPLRLNPQGPMGLGVEINVDYTAACVVDLTGAVRSHRTLVSDNRSARPATALRRAARLAQQVVADVGAVRLAGACVAVPGLVDEDGLLRFAPNLPSFAGLPLVERLQSLLPAAGPVDVDNEANLAALADLWFGDETLGMEFIHVSGEIGVGSGVVIAGELFRGVRGYAGELGHVVVDPAGPPCSCGSNGCLEQLAGQEALLRAAGVVADAGTSTAAPDAVAELLRRLDAHDPTALDALASAGHALGLALSNVVNVLDVPQIVLGGLYSRLAPWLVDPIRSELDRRAISHGWTQIEVRASQLGADAAVRGAAGLVVQRVIANPAQAANGATAVGGAGSAE